MDINLVGINITVASFILVVLLWLAQHHKDQRTLRHEYTQLQLKLLDRRNNCFMVFREFYAQLYRNYECEDIIQFDVPSHQQLIVLGYEQLFSPKLVTLIDEFLNDAKKQKIYQKNGNYDESYKLYNELIDRVMIIEKQFILESRLIK